MEDEKLRELSKDFLKSNVVYRFISFEGVIKHGFKNGKERKKHSKAGYVEYRKLEREKKLVRAQIEEIFQLV